MLILSLAILAAFCALLLLPIIIGLALEALPFALGLLVCWWLFHALGCL